MGGGQSQKLEPASGRQSHSRAVCWELAPLRRFSHVDFTESRMEMGRQALASARSCAPLHPVSSRAFPWSDLLGMWKGSEPKNAAPRAEQEEGRAGLRVRAIPAYGVVNEPPAQVPLPPGTPD